jgi:hypothetical protein
LPTGIVGGMADGVPASFDPRPFIESRSGWPDAMDWLSGYLADRALADIEEQVSSAYVSNVTDYDANMTECR